MGESSRLVKTMATDFTSELEYGTPLEIVLEDPAKYLELYRYTTLLDEHPVRIVIPVAAGFSKAVKLAVALNFAVKLDMRQPDAELLKEVEEVLDLYLHRSNVRQPIDFFQTTLMSFFYEEPISLWEVNEEQPVWPDHELECHDCKFLGRCGGYFKVPDKTYSCDGVKRVFQTLASATDEMRNDLAAFEAMGVQSQP